jgi:nucleotide-binding universal stress UspA family protein
VAHPQDLLARAEELVSMYLRDLAERIQSEDGTPAKWKVLWGDAATEIVELARSTENNMVAMCTHGRSGVGRWVLGSVTDKVVRSSGDPVLVVRPD